MEPSVYSAGVTTGRRRQRYGVIGIVVVLALGIAAFVGVAWIRDGDKSADAIGASVRRPRSLQLFTECATDLTATVIESTDEVRVDRIEGDVQEDDGCAGSVTVELERRLGSRTLIVNGVRWYRGTRDCPAGNPGQFGPVPTDAVAGCK